jgi:hypothetical protein
MAYINGNKPIITNGLVYALDFGNTKSYTSGANTARSLVYDTAVTTVTGSTGLPTLVNGVLNITSSQFIRRTGSLDSIDPNGAFTISLVAKSNTVGSLLTQNLTGKVFQIQSTPSSSNIGFNLGTGTYSRTIPGFNSGSLQHISFRYNSGSIDTFLNGIPVTSSIANASLRPTGQLNALFFGSGSNSFSGSLANLYVYNRALTPDEIYENYLVMAGRYSLPVVPKPYSIDENLYQWVQATNTTDTNTISAISTFISGLKSAGLWNKIQTIYPFVGTTTGSQTINLKEPGLYRLGLTGSFSASSAGLSPSSSTSFVDSIPGNTVHPLVNSASAHLSLLSYDTPAGNGFLGGNSARAIGGDRIVSSGSRVYHAFLTTGTSSFTMIDASITNVEVLVVGGGGAGSTNRGGGGGAGGVVYSGSYIITPGNTLEVIVGRGALNGEAQGHNTVFNNIVAFGGGRGGNYGGGGGNPGTNGGSGGGGGLSTGIPVSGGLGVPGQGNDGGYGGSVYTMGGGGGGGASTPGQDTNVDPVYIGKAGDGGSGSYFPQYSGINLGAPAGWFGGGGGGSFAYRQGGNINYRGAGGIGGGGVGSTNRSNNTTQPTGSPGIPNTGGGGGSRGDGETLTDNSGGSGIVIVSYNLPASALTGSGTGLYLTDSGITGSVNSQFTAGITGSGTIGFLTVSRTGSGVFSIHKNNVSQSVASASLGVLSTDIFFNTANLAGSGSLPLPATLAYASIGAGLTTSEVATYYNLVSQLQTNLKRQNTLLDTYSGAAAAYSLRRIGPSGYFGPAIRVRRDSDNTLRDIGFTSDGQLDTVGLLDFVGVTGSGFVNTWYDQSGNSRNLSQATNVNQPLVSISGSIVVQDIKPALSFNGSRRLSYTSNATFLSNVSVFSVFKSDTTKTFQNVFGFGNNIGSSGVFTFYNYWGAGVGLNKRVINTNTWAIADGNSTTNKELWSSISSNTVRTLNINTTPQTLDNTGVTINLQLGNIGISSTDNTYALQGTVQENLIYPSDQTTNRSAIELNINSNYKIFGSATASFDPDYQAFITATGITEPTQSAALETLVSDLKSYGLWSKMKAIYPMVTDKNNRFAQSEDFSLTWNAVSSSVTVNQITAPNGTSTADLIRETTGSNPYQTFTVVNNGASAYTIDGSDNPTLTLERGRTYVFDINASGHPFYIMTGSGAYTVDGQYNTGVTGQGTQTGTLTFAVPSNAPDTLAYVCQFHSAMGGTISVINNTDQHYVYQTVDNLVTGNEYVLSVYGRFLNRPWIALQSNDGAQAWFNLQTGVTGSFTGSRVSITNVGSGWYRCALFYTASSAGAKNQHIHLADADGNYSYTGVATTGSYLWGAQFENGNVLGPYRATTVTGFTTGSMLDQMKFNLKSTSSFSGSYVGNWNPGYGGNKPDGVTGYINTNYNPSTSGLLNSAHLSHYGTTNLGIGTIFQLVGVKEGSNIQGLAPTVLGGDSYNSINSTDVPIGTIYTRVDSFILSNRNSPIEFNNWYKNNKVSTVVRNSTSIPNGNIFISGRNNNGSLLFPDLNTKAFVTIGDGLTDYEAKALYWIVQKFQTTLGRQVY